MTTEAEKMKHTPGCKKGWRISGCDACEIAIESHDRLTKQRDGLLKLVKDYREILISDYTGSGGKDLSGGKIKKVEAAIKRAEEGESK